MLRYIILNLPFIILGLGLTMIALAGVGSILFGFLPWLVKRIFNKITKKSFNVTNKVLKEQLSNLDLLPMKMSKEAKNTASKSLALNTVSKTSTVEKTPSFTPKSLPIDKPISNTGNNKVILLNDVLKELKKLKKMEEIIEKLNNENKKNWIRYDYMSCVDQVHGDYKLIEHIKKMDAHIKYLYKVKIKCGDKDISFDHVFISQNTLYILDTSNLKGNIYVDSNEQFYMIDNEGKLPIDNPIEKLNRKIDCLIDALHEFGITESFAIISANTVVGNDSSIKNEGKVKGITTNFKYFTHALEGSTSISPIMNKVAFFLSEFSESTPIDFLEEYDLKPEDFLSLS